ARTGVATFIFGCSFRCDDKVRTMATCRSVVFTNTDRSQRVCSSNDRKKTRMVHTHQYSGLRFLWIWDHCVALCKILLRNNDSLTYLARIDIFRARREGWTTVNSLMWCLCIFDDTLPSITIDNDPSVG